MLCASMVLGNAGNLANASNVITLGETRTATPSNAETAATPSNASEIQNFELKDKELYEAFQEGIETGRFAEAEFRGGSADEYEEFFSEPGDYYELKLAQMENKDMALRVFVRLEESELLNGEQDDYIINGSETLMFLLINQSEQDQKAVITVNQKHTGEIFVPVNVEEEIWAETTSPVIDLTGEETMEMATPSDAVTATPSDVPEEVIPSEEEHPEDLENQLQGELYGLTGVEHGTAVGFITTTGAVGLDKLELIATGSNALVRYSMSVEGGEDVVVDVTAKRGALPEGAEMRARYLPEDGSEYKQAKDSLDAALADYSGMMALDIGFWLNEEEVEPKSGSEVQVKIRMDANLLPDDVDVGTLKVQHHEETPNGIQIKTVAKAVSVENTDAEVSDETLTATPSNIQEERILEEISEEETWTEEQSEETVKMSLRSLPNEPVPVDEIISEDIAADEDMENQEEALMDTVEAELGTLRVVESGDEAAVVETAFVVDSFSKFTITWTRIYSERKVIVQYVDESGKELDINSSVNGSNIFIDKDVNLSSYIVKSDLYEFQYIILKDSDGRQLLKTTKGEDIYSKQSWLGKWGFYYKENGIDHEVPNNSTISLVYKRKLISETLEMVPGVDTKDNINITLFDYDEKDGVEGFLFGSNSGWTGTDGGVRQGLVQRNLHKGGYPVLVKGRKPMSKFFGGTGIEANYLFQVDEDNYFSYDSKENFAHLYKIKKEFILYNVPKNKGTGIPPSVPQFLPFNDLSGEVVNKGSYKEYQLKEKNPDYYFGMMIDFQFIMPKDGKLNGQDMVFEFEGDDDVWVFIDDVLVLDMGGVHDNYGGSINFATGNVNVDKVFKGEGKEGTPQRTSIQKEFGKAGKQWNDENYKPHTLKFFYMERGAFGSNCKIKFNMPTIPSGTINFEKNLDYANVQYAKDLKFKFKTFVDYDGDNKNYQLYQGHYKVYDRTIPNKPVFLREGTVGKDGIISLKHKESAQLDEETILDTSRFYIQEIGATSDKYNVSIEGVKVEVVDETGKPISGGSGAGHGFAAQTDDVSVGENPYVVFNNKVKAENQFNLIIKKEMAAGQISDEGYGIHVKLGGVPYEGSYNLHQKNGSIVKKQIDTNKKGEILLKPGEYAEIIGLVGGTKIEITEPHPGVGYANPVYTLDEKSPVTKVENNENSICVIAKEGKELGEDPVVKITVTNEKTVRDLTVKKIVEGELGEKERPFTFVIKDVSEKPKGGWSYEKTDGTKGTIPEDGTFTLKHNEAITITGLPVNQAVVIEEIDGSGDGYETQWSVNETNGFQDGTKYEYKVGETTNQVIFKNKKSLPPPTGIFTDNLPYFIMFAMAAIGLLGFGYSRKRVKKSRDDD